MERFEKCRIHDFKVMFIKYLENHLEHQAKVRNAFCFSFLTVFFQLIKYWEAFLPEAKSIA